MGMQDRDWYKEEMRARKRAESRSRWKWKSPFGKRQQRIPVDLLDNANPKRSFGANWHWSLKLLVCLCLATAMLVSWKRWL